ncbi:ANTAR domain-containing response regulator [Aliamphritea ceti]|uniref:ANTAR domain-containing response regulator n=1 Tax=Aliamphritea ceti TaxID=1524258 RepID=UPI0021C2E8AF|nr:ANTAR domain-containing protein [Aliamphritea ceti]
MNTPINSRPLYSRLYLLDDQQDTDQALMNALTHLGYDIHQACQPNLLADLQQASTDIIFIRQQQLSPQLLEQLKLIQQWQPVPVIIFTESDHQATAEQAILAGASSYIVSGLQYKRLASIIRVACLRFEATKNLQQNLAQAEQSLDERKLIEQAKGLVMRHQKCDEQQAFIAMRNMSMSQSISLGKLARQLITALEH